jgi:hypothetical protein
MNAAFKKVRGAIGPTDPVLRDLIVTRIVELGQDGVYDIEELSTRTRSRSKPEGQPRSPGRPFLHFRPKAAKLD